MTLKPPPLLPEPIIYPDSDGLPMSDNTRQSDWITLIVTNLALLFHDNLRVFVAQNLLWYAVEGQNEISAAPDVLVAFNRPKGYRGSYKTWEEEGVPLTVVFEILSPSNTAEEMANKFAYYEEYGVEEYYIYNPDTNALQIFLRRGTVLRRHYPADGFVSPRLKITFDLSSGPELIIRHPTGRLFLPLTNVELERIEAVQRAADAAKRADDEAKRADEQTKRADDALKRVDDEAKRANDEAKRANDEAKRANDEAKRADDEAKRADDEAKRADEEKRQKRRLAELTRKVMRGEATSDDLTELTRLTENGSASPE